MIRQNKSMGIVTIYCNEVGCDNKETIKGLYGYYGFCHAIKLLKMKGWKSKRNNKRFHSCPGCSM